MKAIKILLKASAIVLIIFVILFLGVYAITRSFCHKEVIYYPLMLIIIMPAAAYLFEKLEKLFEL